jgi:hypothetical protein
MKGKGLPDRCVVTDPQGVSCQHRLAIVGIITVQVCAGKNAVMGGKPMVKKGTRFGLVSMDKLCAVAGGRSMNKRDVIRTLALQEL